MRRLKFLKILFFLFTVVFIFKIYSSKIKDINKKEIPASKHIKIFSNNAYCEIEGEWLSLSNLTFFKKTAAYFIVDLNMIYLNFLQHYKINSEHFKFNLTIEIIKDKNSTAIIKKSFTKHKLQSIERWATNYQTKTVQIRLNLFKVLDKALGSIQDLINTKRLKMKLQILDEALGYGLRLPLELKIKYSPHHYKLDKHTPKIAVCTKVLFIDKEQQFNDFKMWVHLSELIGYGKLIVHNRPGYIFDLKRENFFNRHKDLLEVRHQICMPNIHDPIKERYFHKSILKNLTGPYLTTIDNIAFLYLMECYLDHFDHFKYILLILNNISEVCLIRNLNYFILVILL